MVDFPPCQCEAGDRGIQLSPAPQARCGSCKWSTLMSHPHSNHESPLIASFSSSACQYLVPGSYLGTSYFYQTSTLTLKQINESCGNTVVISNDHLKAAHFVTLTDMVVPHQSPSHPFSVSQVPLPVQSVLLTSFLLTILPTSCLLPNVPQGPPPPQSLTLPKPPLRSSILATPFVPASPGLLLPKSPTQDILSVVVMPTPG